MKNILFPTDFSELSDVALQTAIDIAKKTDAKIFVVNAFYVPALDINAAPLMSQELYSDEKAEVEHDLEVICQKISMQKSDTGKFLQTEYLAELNIPAKEILKAAEEKNIDLIVMGSEAKKSFLDFMSSTSWEVVREAKCNILIVNENSVLKPINNIYFAVQSIKNDIYSIKEVVALARIYNSEIFVLHVNSFATTMTELKETRQEDQDARDFINAIKIYVNYDNIVYYPVFSDEISEGINHSIQKHECDMLAVLKQERSWSENLFHKSVIKELLANAETPLLIVH